MVITYNGENYFKCQSGNSIILIDPTNQRAFKGADLILNTQKPASVPKQEDDGAFWIDHQGEYEIKGIQIQGWSAKSENGKEKTLYRFNFDDIVFVVLGHITEEPDSKLEEHLKNADCLILPVGGKPWLSPGTAAKLIRQLEPSIILPSLYENIKPFLKEFSQEKCEPEEKFTFKKKDLRPGAMEIKCLKS